MSLTCQRYVGIVVRVVCGVAKRETRGWAPLESITSAGEEFQRVEQGNQGQKEKNEDAMQWMRLSRWKGESGSERGADFVYVCESCSGEPLRALFRSPFIWCRNATQRTASAEQAQRRGGTDPVSISPATGWSIARQSLPRRNWPKRLLSRGRRNGRWQMSFRRQPNPPSRPRMPLAAQGHFAQGEL